MPDCTGRIRLSSQAILLGVQALNDIARLIVDSPVSWMTSFPGQEANEEHLEHSSMGFERVGYSREYFPAGHSRH